MESMMYKPGDKVMIRPDLKEYECYYMLSGPKKGKECSALSRVWLHRLEKYSQSKEFVKTEEVISS